jgi:hypothetical protein
MDTVLQYSVSGPVNGDRSPEVVERVELGRGFWIINRTPIHLDDDSKINSFL